MGLLGMLNSLAQKRNDRYSDDDNEMRDSGFDEEYVEEEEENSSGSGINLDVLNARERRLLARMTKRNIRMCGIQGESRLAELMHPFWRWWYNFWDNTKPIRKVILKVLIIAFIAYVVIGLFIDYVIL